MLPLLRKDFEAVAFLAVQEQKMMVTFPNFNVRRKVMEQEIVVIVAVLFGFESLTAALGMVQVVIVVEPNQFTKPRVRPLTVQCALCLLHSTALYDAFQQLYPSGYIADRFDLPEAVVE